MRRFARTGGFSLVEVAISIGLSAMSLSLLMALLPTGLQMSSNARRQAEASSFLKHIATGIHAAVRQEDDSYRILGVEELSEISWNLGDDDLDPVEGWLTSSGVPVPVSAEDAAFAYRIEFSPPQDAWTSGRAVVRVAWPVTSHWVDGAWKRSQGDVRSLVLFRPQ